MIKLFKIGENKHSPSTDLGIHVLERNPHPELSGLIKNHALTIWKRLGGFKPVEYESQFG